MAHAHEEDQAEEDQRCSECEQLVDVDGYTISAASHCGYCPILCEVCGYGDCDQSC